MIFNGFITEQAECADSDQPPDWDNHENSHRRASVLAITRFFVDSKPPQ
jgi:hypothetical protein